MKIFTNVLMGFMLFWCMLAFSLSGSGQDVNNLHFFNDFVEFAGTFDTIKYNESIEEWSEENLVVDFDENDSSLISVLKHIYDVLLYIPRIILKLVSALSYGIAFTANCIIYIFKFFQFFGYSVF